jgi:hypothetical protein
MDKQHHMVLHERAEEKLEAILEYVQDIPDMRVLKFATTENSRLIAQNSRDLQGHTVWLAAVESSLTRIEEKIV